MNIEYTFSELDKYFVTRKEQVFCQKFINCIKSNFSEVLESSKDVFMHKTSFEDYLFFIVDKFSTNESSIDIVIDTCKLRVCLTLQEIHQTIVGLKTACESVQNPSNDFRISNIKNSYKQSIELLKLQFIDLLNILKQE